MFLTIAKPLPVQSRKIVFYRARPIAPVRRRVVHVEALGKVAEVIVVDALWLVVIGSSLAATTLLVFSFLRAKKQVDQRRHRNSPK